MCSFDIPSPLKNNNNNFLIFWHYRMPQLTLYIPWPDQSQALSPETLSSFPWINNIRNQNLGTSYAHCYCGIKWKTQKYLCVCVHTHLYLTLPDSMDCSLPNSSVRRIFSVEILEWVPTFSSGGSFWPGRPACVSCSLCTGRRILYYWTNREDLQVCTPTLNTRKYIDSFKFNPLLHRMA